MHKFILSLFVLIVPLLWSAGLEGQEIRTAKEVTRNVTYCTPRGKPLKMDVYYPHNETSPRSLAIFVHGGFWMGGDKTGEFWFHKIGSALLEEGMVVASINYRLGPRYTFPVQLWDVRCAIRHFRAQSAQYNIHPQRIGLWGTSAGGHLAALAGTTGDTTVLVRKKREYEDQSDRPNAVVSLYAPLNLTAGDFHPELQNVAQRVFASVRHEDENGKAVSPFHHVSQNDPPFLLIHGTNDRLVPYQQAQAFMEALQNQGGSAELITVPKGEHGLQVVRDPRGISPEEIQAGVINFFQRVLR